MSTINKRLASSKTRVTNCANIVLQDCESVVNAERLKTKLDDLNQAWERLTNLFDQYIDTCHEDEINELENTRMTYATKYAEARGKAKSIIVKLDKGDNDEKHQPMDATSLALTSFPKLKLPVFSGNYEDWVAFKDIYIPTIHDNKNMPKALKLQHLKMSLSDAARRRIQSIPNDSEDAYDKAWQILLDRYENKRLLVSKCVHRLLDIPVMPKNSASHLRQFMDTVTDCSTTLSLLDHPIDDSVITTYIILRKLDGITREKWESSLIDDQVPTFKQLLIFLEQRTKSLESISSTPTYVKESNSMKPTLAHVSTRDVCAHCKDHHLIYKCEAFLKLPIEQRIEFVQTNRLCYNCLRKGHQKQNCRSSLCRICNQPHHTLIHKESNDNPSSTENQETNSSMLSHFSLVDSETVVLATVTLFIKGKNGESQQCRAFFDSGSHRSFITEQCLQRLGLPRQPSNIHINSLGGTNVGKVRGAITLQVTSRFDFSKKFFLNTLVLPEITSELPTNHFELQSQHKLKNLPLADPEYNTPEKIDMLIGADYYIPLMKIGTISLLPKGLYAQNTFFGWVIMGRVHQSKEQKPNTIQNFHLCTDIDQRLRTFWELEEIQETSLLTEEEQLCETHFRETVTRATNGRFIVRLPFKNTAQRLTGSRPVAEKRFKQIEGRFQTDPEFGKQYQAEIYNYLKQGHLELCSFNCKVGHFYLPHHAVIKTSSLTTKMRIVFDASAKTNFNPSLNSQLLVGPTVQDDLFDILLRFRMYNIALTADIEQMYRQIIMHEDDRDYQRILWRDEASSELRDYRLNTVTFGIASAPYLATKCLQTLANEFTNTFPNSSKILARDFYVDDLITGTHTISEAIQIHAELTRILNSAGFNLRKWASNSEKLIQAIPSKTVKNTNSHTLITDSNIKTLGILWQRHTDKLTFQITDLTSLGITKRTILSQISKIFDPFGWLSPCTVRAKLLMQQLWLKGLSWDESLPSEILNFWQNYCKELKSLESIAIDRCVFFDSANVRKRELHGFCDASEKAYAAVIFIRSTYNDSTISSRLLCSKTKVAPVKTVSLPRLELCAAHLLAKLVRKVKQTLNIPISNVVAWSDSTITLSWLRGHPSKWKTFVANRTSFIQEIIPPVQWKYIPTADNPADPASRGITVENLKRNNLWWHGPSWLITENTPSSKFEHDQRAEIEKKGTAICFNVCQEFSIFSRFSSYLKLIRVTAYCKRFSYNTRHPNMKRIGFLTVHEFQEAHISLIKLIQTQAFAVEIAELRKDNPLPITSKLIKLNPFLDAAGTLRVGGRLRNYKTHTGRKHPILLPHNHSFVNLLINHEHLVNLHAGPQLLLASLRKNYWILDGRNAIRFQIHRCLKCFRLKARPNTQIMGALPEERVNPSRPFSNCGVDYAGPITIKISNNRSGKTQKGYICLFVCLSTKAVHLEATTSLSTEAFLSALRRFVSRRGLCANIYSDCATNFVGANRELREILKSIQSSQNSEEVKSFFLNREVKWHFIPPGSPHFGGLWEAGVKSVKHHLYRVLGQERLSFEELYTTLTEIEACLNSRPLYPMSADPNDLSALTPAHFLMGDTLNNVPDDDVTKINQHRLSRWQRVQQLTQNLWRRWQAEYLPQLQISMKWNRVQENLKLNDLVLIKHEVLPPTQWLLGRVTAIHPGKDGKVRVVDLRTKNGQLKRCVNKICVLPTT